MPVKATKRAVAAGSASVSWAAATALDTIAMENSDYTYCKVSGSITGKPFEVNYTEIYDLEPFKSDWGSENFRNTIRYVVNMCIKLTVDRYAEMTHP